MKRTIIFIVIAVLLAGMLVGGGYYWYKKKNEPPPPITYTSIEEVDKDIERLEPLYKEGRLSWQDTYQLGIAYMQRGKIPEAVKPLEDVAKVHPGFYKTYESLGMVHYRMDEMEKAVAAWRKALNISPQASHLEDMIGRATQRMQLKARVGVLEQDIQQDRRNWQKRLELAVIYLGLNRVDEARVQLGEVLKLKKDSAEVYDTVAQAYATSGDFDKAIAAEKKASQLNPKNENIKKRLAELEKIRVEIKKRGNQR